MGQLMLGGCFSWTRLDGRHNRIRNVWAIEPDTGQHARVMGRPCMSATIWLTETMCYIGQGKVEDRKGYPICIAGM